MQDKARAELQKISEDLGVNLLDLIESTAQQRKSELDEVVVHKEVNEEPVEEPSPDSQSQLEVAKSANAETASATDVPPVLTQEQSQPTPIDQEQFVKSLVEQVSTALIAKVSEEFGMESLSEAISTLTDRLQQTQATLDKQQSDVQMLTEQITELKRSDEDRLAEKEAHLPKFGAWSWQRMSQSETNVLSPNDPLTKATPVQAKVPDAIVRLAEQK